ncbi:phage virion morphogenesis protein [Porticoccaceae bacterium]|nr:phage virion morphogenesis protein [Porticoccaceae bacterium]
MAAINFEIQAGEVNKALDRALKLGDTAKLMSRIGRALVTDIDFNFRRSQGPDGRPWKPLKSRKGQPLRDTGRLQRSIVFDADKSQVAVGTNVLYAPTHQFGAVIKPKKGPFLIFAVPGPGGKKRFVFARQVEIPARPFIGLETRQVDKINSLVDKWSNEVLNANQ